MSSRPRFRQMLTRPLARGVWVGYYNQLIQLGLQLLGVPILIGAWGAHDYGVWLILSAIPAYFVMSDFGMTTAATNDMLANATRGEIDKVVRVDQSLRLLVLMSCGTILSMAALLLALFGTWWLGFAAQATGGHPSLTMLLLVAYGLLTIANGLLDAGFRAADRFATGRLVLATNSLVESVLMFTAVLLGAGLFHAALILLLARVAGSIAGLFLLKLKVPWLAKVSWQLDFTEIKRLSEPALASMAFPVANALIYQGSTIVIGAALSPAMVPIFSTARTLTRVALQILTVVSVASLQRFTIAYAARDEHKMDRLILLNLAIVLFVLLPAAGVAAVFGRWIIAIWTHGKVHTPYLVLYLLAAGMVCNGVWVVMCNFVIAINRQSTISYFYLFATSCGCVLGYALSRMFGIAGMAMSSLMVDITLAFWTIRTAMRLGLINVGQLAVTARAEVAVIRGMIGGRSDAR